MTEEDGLLGFVGGYAAAAAIMAGPWIITVLTVGMLSLLSPGINRFDLYITHVYPVSLILVGFLQFPATRHLADLLYVRRYERVFGSFNATLLLGMAASSVFGLVWALTTPGPQPDWSEKLLVIGLLNVISAQWISLIFLVTIHRYWSILGAFVVGGFVSIVYGAEIAGPGSEKGALAGYLIGQLLTLLWLLAAFMREYPARPAFDFGFLQWFRRSPSLALAGGFFYLGSFADKLVFRYGHVLVDNPHVGTLRLGPWLYLSDPYESLTFLAQLTIVPALAVFYIKLETGFFEVYKAFYNTIDNRGTLQQLRLLRDQIGMQLRESAKTVFATQGVFTLLAVLLAPNIFPWAATSPLHTSILRASMVAAFFAIFVLLSVVIFLYFEFYREAFLCALLYFVLNGGLTAASLFGAPRYYGWASILAGLISAACSSWLLKNRVDDLLYRTFSKAPVKTLPHQSSHSYGVGEMHFDRGVDS